MQKQENKVKKNKIESPTKTNIGASDPLFQIIQMKRTWYIFRNISHLSAAEPLRMTRGNCVMNARQIEYPREGIFAEYHWAIVPICGRIDKAHSRANWPQGKDNETLSVLDIILKHSLANLQYILVLIEVMRVSKNVLTALVIDLENSALFTGEPLLKILSMLDIILKHSFAEPSIQSRDFS